MTLHIVEPHADDAFLSLHAHIGVWVKCGRSVVIHTITGEPRRMKEAKEYADRVGASWEGYGAEDSIDLTGFACLRLAAKGQLVLPIAISHPVHAAVKLRLADAGAWYYVDQPYAITQKNSEPLTAMMKGMRVESYLKPPARKYALAAVFKSQAKFFHYNPASKLSQTFELIVRR